MRTALAGPAALLLALSACGQSDSTGAAPDDTTEDGDSGVTAEPTLRPPVPVRSGGGGAAAGANPALGAPAAASQGAEAESADMATSGPAGELSMLAPWSSLSFAVSGDLALPTNDTGYVYAGTVSPDLDAIASLARALGVDGDVSVVPTNEGGGWRVGPNDGTAASLQVSASGQLDWWFSPAWESDRAIAEPDCVISIDSADIDAEVDPAESGLAPADDADLESSEAVPPPFDDCEFQEPTPPENVPTADEALALANDLLAATDLDATGMEPTTYADQWSASVSYQRTDSSQPPMFFDFGFGANGELQWASGILGTPEAAGPYPLIGLDEALERLNSTYGFDDGEFATGPLGQVSDLSSLDTEVSSDAAVSGPAPEAGEMPEPVDHVVTVSGVTAGLWTSWDTDGSVWYIPAYEFTGDDGTAWSVPAVTDEFLIEEQDFVVNEPGDELPVDDFPNPIPDDEAAVLVGLSEAEALDTAEAAGWDIRIVAVDGEQFAVTEDYSPQRVNVSIVDGVVTDVYIG